MEKYVALAIPFFFALIGVELVWARARGRRVYRFNDAITDLSCGITSQISAIFCGAIIIGCYARVYEHGRLVELRPSSPWTWVAAFLGVDFCFYWWHRMSHEVNVLWAAHIVHHQSEDYNLAVALRQSVLTGFTALPFYLPLALLGIPPVVFVTSHAFSILYQFWIHTQLVRKIGGPLDYVLNLPSHHRVHHAKNLRYLDKNYGATLIVWDRLFGTYEEETEAPVYGTTKPLASYDALWAQFHYWAELWSLARSASRWQDALQVWVRSPAWRPFGVAPYPTAAVRPESYAKYERPLSRGLRLYIGVNYGVLVIATFLLLLWQQGLSAPRLAVASVAVMLPILTFGALIEGWRWARLLELLRIVGTLLLIVMAGAGLFALR